MSLSFPTVLVISSAPERIDLLRQDGSQLALATYASMTSKGCPLDAEVCLIDPACDPEEFKKSLDDPQIKCIIILFTKDALEDERVLALARTAILGTKGRYICHIVHYYWDQTVIYKQLPTDGCTMLPSTVGNSMINLFRRMAEYNLSRR